MLAAYVLPGLMILCGVSLVSPTARNWLGSAETASWPSAGGLLFAMLFSVAAGLTANAIHWLLLDRLGQPTGIKRPSLGFGSLEHLSGAFEHAVERLNRHELYGGMFIASLFSYGLWRWHGGRSFGIYDLCFLIIEVVFAMALRDALRNDYGSAARVPGITDSEAFMTNGSGHHEDVPTATSPRGQEKKAPPASKAMSPSGKDAKPVDAKDNKQK